MSTTEDYSDLGLEDVSASESAPRLRISHRDGRYINTQTGEEYETFTGIPLGVIRGRVMFPKEIDVSGNGKPLCKSPDAITGFPNINPKLPADKRFDWEGSGYNEAEVPLDARGHMPILCEACAYSNWHDKTPPPCAEQWTVPMVYPRQIENSDQWDWDNLILVTFQKSSMTPAKRYASSFKQTRQPMFSAQVTLGLDIKTRGSVVYAESTFTRGPDVPQEHWPRYADLYRSFRDYLHEPPPATSLAVLGAPQTKPQLATPATYNSNGNGVAGGTPSTTQTAPIYTSVTPALNAPVNPNAASAVPAAPPAPTVPPAPRPNPPPAPASPSLPPTAPTPAVPAAAAPAAPLSVGTPPPPFTVPSAPSAPPPPSAPTVGQPLVVDAVPDTSPAEALGADDEDDLPF